MPLDAHDHELLAAFRVVVREELARADSPRYPAARAESMTVAEFAHVVRLHKDTVLLKIRRRAIPKEMVSKKAKTWRIMPSAAPLFGVPMEEAAARLAAFREQHPQQSEQPSLV